MDDCLSRNGSNLWNFASQEAAHGWNLGVMWLENVWSESPCTGDYGVSPKFSYQCINIRSSPGAAVRQTPLTPWCHLSLSSPGEPKTSLYSQDGNWIRVCSEAWCWAPLRSFWASQEPRDPSLFRSLNSSHIRKTFASFLMMSTFSSPGEPGEMTLHNACHSPRFSYSPLRTALC